MAEINVNIPGVGLQSFEIDGDEPTQEESIAIRNYINKNQKKDTVTDFMNLARQQKELNLNETDPSQYVDPNIARSPEREKYDTDVDYSSGIKNQGFRLRFSNLNTDKERAPRRGPAQNQQNNQQNNNQ